MDILYLMVKCFLRENTYKRSDKKKTNKKQFKILEKDVYVTPDEIFEAFERITDDLTMNDDEYLRLIERSKMQT